MGSDAFPGADDAGVPGVAEAVALLLVTCPELETLWAGAFESEDPNEVGVYNVFGQIILPVLHTLLTGQPSPQLDGLLPTGEAERGALTSRIYEVLDRWATSEDVTVRDAVYLEMTEGDYGGLWGEKPVTVDALVAPAGPALKSLIEKQRRMPWGPLDDYLQDQ